MNTATHSTEVSRATKAAAAVVLILLGGFFVYAALHALATAPAQTPMSSNMTAEQIIAAKVAKK